jgi:uncharacterized protein YdhG (YjbR/CyaY superfamily)
MDNRTLLYQTIDEYIALFPLDIQTTLNSLRQYIRFVAPEATEKISYQMPTFYLEGNLVHFAAYPHHIGIYPGSSGVAAFLSRLSDYSTSKGAIQFPIGKPLPFALIGDIVSYRVAENKAWALAKKQKISISRRESS